MNSSRNIQFLKFIIVGGINTAVTLLVIMLCKSVIGIDPYLSNALGYLAGISNSFLWNRGWVFNSHGFGGHFAVGIKNPSTVPPK